MRALIVYYSRTGHTRKVAEELSKELSCDVEELKDTANRSGPIGWLTCGREASGKMLAKLHPVQKDPAAYDIVVIGTPIWARSMSSPVRTFLTEAKPKLKDVAFFCTEGSKGSESAFGEMGELIGKKPKATLAVTTEDLQKGIEADKVRQFARDITA
jgi:flavodoxin